MKLSGGQHQQVSIARGILADPRVLILDAATSSLDSESEALNQDGLQKLRRLEEDLVINPGEAPVPEWTRRRGMGRALWPRPIFSPPARDGVRRWDDRRSS